MVKSSSKGQLDMTQGNLFPQIIKFVIPIILTNFLQSFYSAADMIVVGMSNVEGAVGSIGITNGFVSLMLNIFMGFSIGANVIVANKIGKGDRENVEKSVHTSVILSVLFGIVCMAIGLSVNKSILKLLGGEGYVLKLAVTYTTYYFIGAPFASLANTLISIFRAKGDTRTPMIVLAGSGLLNVALNLFFVLVCKMSVDGVAIATAASNLVSAAILLYILSKDSGWCRFSFKKLKLDIQSFKEILYVAIPSAIQGSLFALSNMVIQSSIIEVNNQICPGGSAIVDGHSAASSIEAFLYACTNSMNTAAVTFTSQNHGAKNYKRIGSIMKCCYLLTTVIAISGSLIIMLFKNALIGLYVSDPVAIQTAITRMYILIAPYFTIAWLDVGSGVVRGLGKSVTSTIVSLVGTCALRIVWIYTVCAAHPMLELIYLSYPISWMLTATVQFICAMIIKSKYQKQLESAK